MLVAPTQERSHARSQRERVRLLRGWSGRREEEERFSDRKGKLKVEEVEEKRLEEVARPRIAPAR